jgi:type III pantothenate kinase
MYNSLAVDIGNTRTKFGYFQNREVQFVDSIDNELVVEKSKQLNDLKLDGIIVSSVNPLIQTKINFSEFEVPVLELDYKIPLPVKINYQTPETLGKDRIALAVGAYMTFPKQSTLVIDIGTCITYDYISDKGEYLGGAISPGIQLRLNSMNHGTGSLPLINWNEKDKIKIIGDTTISSMLSGVINGIIGEINGFIQSYKSETLELKVLITGGDSSFFDKELKNGIFADPNLVLKGLNEILLYNNK